MMEDEQNKNEVVDSATTQQITNTDDETSEQKQQAPEPRILPAEFWTDHYRFTDPGNMMRPHNVSQIYKRHISVARGILRNLCNCSESRRCRYHTDQGIRMRVDANGAIYQLFPDNSTTCTWDPQLAREVGKVALILGLLTQVPSPPLDNVNAIVTVTVAGSPNMLNCLLWILSPLMMATPMCDYVRKVNEDCDACNESKECKECDICKCVSCINDGNCIDCEAFKNSKFCEECTRCNDAIQNNRFCKRFEEDEDGENCEDCTRCIECEELRKSNLCESCKDRRDLYDEHDENYPRITTHRYNSQKRVHLFFGQRRIVLVLAPAVTIMGNVQYLDTSRVVRQCSNFFRSSIRSTPCAIPPQFLPPNSQGLLQEYQRIMRYIHSVITANESPDEFQMFNIGGTYVFKILRQTYCEVLRQTTGLQHFPPVLLDIVVQYACPLIATKPRCDKCKSSHANEIAIVLSCCERMHYCINCVAAETINATTLVAGTNARYAEFIRGVNCKECKYDTDEERAEHLQRRRSRLAFIPDSTSSSSNSSSSSSSSSSSNSSVSSIKRKRNDEHDDD